MIQHMPSLKLVKFHSKNIYSFKLSVNLSTLLD